MASLMAAARADIERRLDGVVGGGVEGGGISFSRSDSSERLKDSRSDMMGCE